ncbi:MAG TPA: ribonuclease P protein component [Actinomycetota bacterium]
MTKRAQRLTSPRDFRQTFAAGERAHTRHLTCVGTRSSAAGPARVGVTASKRVGPAVHRNRAKRRIREAVRTILPEVPNGCALVVIAKPEADRVDFHILEEELRSAIGSLWGEQ